MPRDDQDFVGFFSSIPTDVKKYSQEVADYSRDFAESVERHFDTVAASIRQTLQTTPWIPDSIKPPPAPVRRPLPIIPRSYLEQTQDWVSRNRAITAFIVAFVGTGAFVIWRRRRAYRQKRRAKRAANGARTEVVILAGSAHSPLTRSIALDLERRGFIVYIPASTLAEEQTIHAELRADIHPLSIDITSPVSTAYTLDKFSANLAHPPRHGTSSTHTLHLAAFIILPSYPSTLPTGTITTLTPSQWSDTLNTHLIYPLGLLHAFLPLLLSQPQPASTPKNPQPPTLLLLSPSLPTSLHLPHHAPESLTTTALTSYLHTLRSETPFNSLTITTLKLGALSLSNPSRAKLTLHRSQRHDSSSSGSRTSSPAEQASWEKERASEARAQALELRELHNGVFDAVVGARTGTVFVGRGSWAYDFVGRWVPGGVVGWMLKRKGARRLGEGGVGDNLGGSAEWERVEGDEGEGGTRVYRKTA
ncbi:hypothetical protein MMC17_003471 [Xylographa soralifera]|nr:hypothetical protein [Xylographa soralifera]